MTSVLKDPRSAAHAPEARCLRIHQCTAAPFNTTRIEGEAPSGWDQRRLRTNPFPLHPIIDWN